MEMATLVTENETVIKLEDLAYRFEVVPIDEMYIDVYQRPKQPIIDTIVKKYNPVKLGTFALSDREHRGKRFSVIDGQQRREALKILGEPEAPALIYEGLTKEEEARIFAELQKDRKAITPFQRFKAELVAKDRQAQAIDRIVRACDFELVDSAGGEKSITSIKAIRAVEKIYEREDGDENLRTVLDLIHETWVSQGLPDAATEWMINGVHAFLLEKENLDPERFIERLGSITPSMIHTRALDLKKGSGAASQSAFKFVREVIDLQYRKPTKRK